MWCGGRAKKTCTRQTAKETSPTASHPPESRKPARQHPELQVPALLYHHVGPKPGAHPELTLSPDTFERQIRWLSRQGCVAIRPSDWLGWLRDGRSLPRKPILLTFDDGYADLAEYAFPILRRYSFSAAVFIVTRWVGKVIPWDESLGPGTYRCLGAEGIRQWAERGIEFGAHSRTHPHLGGLPESQLEEEIAGSRRDLEAILGTKVLSFAYPFGEYDDAALRATRHAYDLAFTTQEGRNERDTEFHLLRRTMVPPKETLVEFALRVRMGRNPLAGPRQRLRIRSRARAALRQWQGHKR